MIVRVHGEGVGLEDLDMLTEFKVVAPETVRGCIVDLHHARRRPAHAGEVAQDNGKNDAAHSRHRYRGPNSGPRDEGQVAISE